MYEYIRSNLAVKKLYESIGYARFLKIAVKNINSLVYSLYNILQYTMTLRPAGKSNLFEYTLDVFFVFYTALVFTIRC